MSPRFLPVKLEYIIIFEKGGTPIYSHCFGGFCAAAGLDDTLLSGFLSALTTMPTMFEGKEGKKQSVQMLEMDYTKLIFSTTSSGKMVVIGVDKEFYDDEEDRGAVSELFDEVEELLEEDFSHITWAACEREDREEFEHKLVEEVLPATLDVYVDYCRGGDDCQFDHYTSEEEPYLSEDMTVWERLKTRYRENRPPWIIRLILRPVLKIANWMDRRNYRSRAREASAN